MVPIHLNLLAPQKKIRLERVVRFLFIRQLIGYCIFTCSVIAIIHLLGWLVLTNLLADLAKSSLIVNRDFPSSNQEIRDTNRILKEINAAGSDYAALTPRLIEIARTLPSNIKLTALKLNRADGSLLIVGTALTRAALLNYEDALSKLPWIGRVNAPSSELFQAENIDFELHAALKGIPALSGAPAAPRKNLQPAE